MNPEKIKADLLRSYQSKKPNYNTIGDKVKLLLGEAPKLTPPYDPSLSLNSDAEDGGTMGLLGYYASLNKKRAEEQAALDRQNVQRNRIAAIGDAVRHLGNIYNTVQGAVPQKLALDYDKQRNNELARLQARWGMEDKDLQNQLNADYKNAVLNLRAKEAEGRQAVNNARVGLLGVQQENAKNADARAKAYNDWRIDNGNKQQKLREAEHERRKAADEERKRHNRTSEGIASVRASNSGGGGGTRRGSGYVLNYGTGRITSAKPMTGEGAKRMVEEYARQHPEDTTLQGFLESKKTKKKTYSRGGVSVEDITHTKNYVAAEAYILKKGDKDFFDKYLKMNGWTYSE